MTPGEYETLQGKWKRRLEIAVERGEPLFVDEAELHELNQMETHRLQEDMRRQPAINVAIHIDRLGCIGDFLAQPVIVDVAKRRQQLDALGETI